LVTNRNCFYTVGLSVVGSCAGGVGVVGSCGIVVGSCAGGVGVVIG